MVGFICLLAGIYVGKNILANDKIEQAQQVANKLRTRFESYPFKVVGKQTISCGVTEYIKGEDEDILLKRVDDALYEAKDSGRNKVVVK